MMRRQVPELRGAFMRAPLERRSRAAAAWKLRAVTGVSPSILRGYLAELDGSPLPAHLRAAAGEYLRTAGDAPGTVYEEEGAVLYALVRALRPATVVETGTANGSSTAYLLAALARNDSGRLVSIDLPFAADADGLHPLVAGARIDPNDASPLPPGRSPGWMVPEELHDRWELRLGDARELLPAALDELGRIEFFFHDSLHTREHMLFEFEQAWPRLGEGGVLAADDIFQRRHDALPAFAGSVGRAYNTFSGLGFVTK